jgi:hypothetical protein
MQMARFAKHFNAATWNRDFVLNTSAKSQRLRAKQGTAVGMLEHPQYFWPFCSSGIRSVGSGTGNGWTACWRIFYWRHANYLRSPAVDLLLTSRGSCIFLLSLVGRVCAVGPSKPFLSFLLRLDT